VFFKAIILAILTFSNFLYLSMANLDALSAEELHSLIKDAQSKLEHKQNSQRKEVIAKIKELAASIGVIVEIIDDKKAGKQKSPSVASKYRNPSNPNQEWTGRGLAPKWMQALIAEGRSKDEFLIS
jgi:DNA-binding protein H-NS